MEHHAIATGRTSLTGARVALLVDGDNIAADRAGQLLVRASRLGSVIVKRVYCDVSHIRNWETSAGFGLRVARTGSNAADMLLTIDAVELAHRADLSAFVLASSDGGFAPLARYLVERGMTVLGLGEPKAPMDWQKSCTRFEVLASPARGDPAARNPDMPAPKAPNAEAPPPVAVVGSPIKEVVEDALLASKVDDLVREVVAAGGTDGILLSAFGDRLIQRGVSKAALAERSWQKYFKARTDRFRLEPASGPGARVRCAEP